MDAEQIDLACLLVSEVVTNAVLHASITPSPGRELGFDLDPVIMTAPVGAPLSPERVPVRPRGRPATVKAVAQSARTATMPVQGWDGPGPINPLGSLDPLSPDTPATGRTGAREFALRLRRGANSVWVEVFDPDLRLPRIRTAADTDEGGRGLYLVEQLATRWGSRPTPEGKAVWFEMPRSGYRP
jgi:hypothetical protein